MTAAGVSATGTFATPEDVFLETFTLAGTRSVTVQTYGVGGGVNAVGTIIPLGGFDTLVALFSSSPASASILLSDGNSVAGDPANKSASRVCGCCDNRQGPGQSGASSLHNKLHCHPV